MKLKKYINILINNSPITIIKKVNGKISNKVVNYFLCKNDYSSESRYSKNIKLETKYINCDKIKICDLEVNKMRYFVNRYINHEFDLLGSGIVKIDYNVEAKGIDGNIYNMSTNITKFDRDGNWLNKILLTPYIKYSKNIWKHIDKDYVPIDWQMDFKSGYRFNQKIWYKYQLVEKQIGVDIKVPWELSRMQHLLQMAVFALFLTEDVIAIIKEFKNQVLDFIMTNPPRMGANWACTMDVGIRIVNMLIAYDIINQLDKNNILDMNFRQIFTNSVYDHAEFIINNLEWYEDLSGNHYLSNICGLLFASAYLERNEKTDAWFAFSIQELIECMKKQFFDDGGNFEASTSYHRLSGELIIYSTAFVYSVIKTEKLQALKSYNHKIIKRLKLPYEQKFNIDESSFFPTWYLDRIFRAGCFTMDITKPNGEIPQVGDNDSGRFIKLTPTGNFISTKEAVNKYINLKGIQESNCNLRCYFDENTLNHGTFISAINGLFNFNKFNYYSNIYSLEKNFIEALSGGVKYNFEYKINAVNLVNNTSIFNLKYSNTTEIKFKNYSNEKIDIEGIQFTPYHQFGIYIYKSRNFYLSIMAGVNGQNGNSGHTHNDKLSFDLNLSGKDIFFDPGTYIYTPLPEKRNEFRSIKAHNAPIVEGQEQNREIALFSMMDETKCYILECSNRNIKIYLTYRDIKIVREFIILNQKLVIKDYCNKKFVSNIKLYKYYSNGYGKITN